MNKYNELIGELNALRSLLEDSDYKTLKFAEGELTQEEYARTKAERKEWRSKINAIEAELSELELMDNG